MIKNIEFNDDRKFVRERYSALFSKLVVAARELDEDVNDAGRYVAKTGEFTISIQVGPRTERSYDFRRLNELLEQMGGVFTSFTLIVTEEFHDLRDK